MERAFLLAFICALFISSFVCFLSVYNFFFTFFFFLNVCLNYHLLQPQHFPQSESNAQAKTDVKRLVRKSTIIESDDENDAVTKPLAVPQVPSTPNTSARPNFGLFTSPSSRPQQSSPLATNMSSTQKSSKRLSLSTKAKRSIANRDSEDESDDEVRFQCRIFAEFSFFIYI